MRTQRSVKTEKGERRGIVKLKGSEARAACMIGKVEWRIRGETVVDAAE